MADWDDSFDFVVMGAGGAGLSAALRAHDLGLSTLIIEKSDQYGGSTAMSGGVCWVANNPRMNRTGIPDSDEDGLLYLESITKGEVAKERLETYIKESKRMVEYLEANSEVRFDPLEKYTDYYPEAPGGRPGGRSMESRPFNGAKLGDELMKLRRPHPQSQLLGKFGITAKDAHFCLVGNWKTKVYLMVCMLRYALRFFARTKWGRDTFLTCGNALMGRLRYSLLGRKVPIWLSTPVESLVQENGRIVGVVVEEDGKKKRIQAKCGVLLASGGFEKNQAMREKYQPKPANIDWAAGNHANTGKGIELGEEAGGQLDLMDEAWWTPATLVPKSDLAWVLVVEKSLPHGIFVNGDGKRFTNEAAPYIDVVHAMYQDHEETGVTVPCWHIFDATYRHNYVIGPVAPGYATGGDRGVPRRYKDGKFFHKADSLDELAESIGVHSKNLQATVETFNGYARQGKDQDFNRGWSASDRYYGDPRVTPNPALGALETGPFYAIQIVPGDLGTKGGLKTDLIGRVTDAQGEPIPGLYAAGNTTASMMGRTYPGAGGTIGPALTFGFLAAEAAAKDGSSQVSLPKEEAKAKVA